MKGFGKRLLQAEWTSRPGLDTSMPGAEQARGKLAGETGKVAKRPDHKNPAYHGKDFWLVL